MVSLAKADDTISQDKNKNIVSHQCMYVYTHVYRYGRSDRGSRTHDPRCHLTPPCGRATTQMTTTTLLSTTSQAAHKNPCVQPQHGLRCNRGSQHKASSTTSRHRSPCLWRYCAAVVDPGLPVASVFAANEQVLLVAQRRAATRTCCDPRARQSQASIQLRAYLRQCRCDGVVGVAVPLRDKLCSTTLEIQPSRTSLG